MEFLKITGILVVIIGFALKWDTIATVVTAGIITGIIAMIGGELTFIQIFEILGSSFVSQRTATLLILTIGVIGICERNGLRDKAVDLIRKLSKATTGGLLSIWLVIRTFSAAFSVRLGGHVQFILPLIHPMAEGAAIAKYGSRLDSRTEDIIKGAANAMENYGNFFAQNCFMGASGTLLIVSTLVEQGFDVNALQIAAASWPIAIIAIIVGIIQNIILDRRLNARCKK